MTLGELAKRVQFLVDDPDGTFADDSYVLGFAQHEYDKLYNKLLNTGYQFDEVAVELPAVQAGTRTLDAYMASGKPLELLVRPRQVEWKLAGQQAFNYRPADGPLDQVRELPDAGLQLLDSWAFIRRSLKLSVFSTAIDLRVTGDFLFDPLTDGQTTIAIASNANTYLACAIASAIGKARGNDKWVTIYSKDADDAFDELNLSMVKAEQRKTERVGRMSRRCRGNP